MSDGPISNAIIFDEPGVLAKLSVELDEPLETDLVVDVDVSAISTGTEKLLWQGTMPPFPGLAYPLVPGYEAVGTVSQAGAQCTLTPGTRVFVPGANCYKNGLRGLFGASASRLVVPQQRVSEVGALGSEQAVLLALAATAMHVLTHRLRQGAGPVHAEGDDTVSVHALKDQAPQLIIGHGVLGRLLARLCVAIGARAPVVWETNESRRSGACGYSVIDPADDDNTPRQHIVDVSGAGGEHFNRLIALLSKGGLLTLAGFYSAPVAFNFAPAFMREANISISAEWVPEDITLVMALIKAGALSLDGLVTHEFPVADASVAYPLAFEDPSCLKTILHWSG